MFQFILRTWQQSSQIFTLKHTRNRAALVFIAIFCFFFCWCLSTWFHQALPNITTIIADICIMTWNRVALFFLECHRTFFHRILLLNGTDPSSALASQFNIAGSEGLIIGYPESYDVRKTSLDQTRSTLDGRKDECLKYRGTVHTVMRPFSWMKLWSYKASHYLKIKQIL